MAGPRQFDPKDLNIANGILADRSRRNARGRWCEGDNVRFYEGLPEKIGGNSELQVTDDEDVLQLYMGHARTSWSWDSLDGQNWIAFGTECKLYLINNDRIFDITPLRQTPTVISGVSTTNGSRIVTVVSTIHDAQDGDHATFKGFSAIGGLDINGEQTIREVLDVDTFTIEVPLPATSTVSNGGGTGVIDFEISCGLESDGTLDGFGTGDYGEGTYGTPREDSTFGGQARVWSLDNFGEDLLASPNGGALYWWQRQTGPNSRAVLRPNAPQNIEHMLVGPDELHVIALGTNLLNQSATAVTGQQDKMFLRWCESDDFDQWMLLEDLPEGTSESDAGSKRLNTGSRLVTAVKTRNMIAIFTDIALYAMSLVGGDDVYDVSPIAHAVRIVSQNGACAVNDTVYIFADKNFYRFDGTLSVLPCEISSLVFDVINRGMQSKAHVRYNTLFNEVHFTFCTTDSDENNATAVLHLDDNTWSFRSHGRESSIDRNAYYGVPVAFVDRTILLEETGTDNRDEPIVAFLRTGDAEINGGANQMLVAQLIPDFTRLEGSVQVQLIGRDDPQDADSEGESELFTVTSTTARIDPLFRKRRMGLYIESSGMGDSWRMDTWQASAGPVGRR